MFAGYVDLGFFWVAGDGTGIRPDIGHLHFPGEYDSIPDSWTAPCTRASRGQRPCSRTRRQVIRDAKRPRHWPRQ